LASPLLGGILDFVRPETIVTKCVVPFAVTGAAAGFSWFFGPHLTDGWQDRQHRFDTKTALVTQLSAASAMFASAIQTFEYHRPSDRGARATYVKAYQAWDEANQVIAAKMDSYYGNMDAKRLGREWRQYVEMMGVYYDLPDRKKSGKGRMKLLRALRGYLSWKMIPRTLLSDPRGRNENLAYQAAWRTIRFGLIKKRDAIVKQLLDDKLVIHS
jgi:hypothetical protein